MSHDGSVSLWINQLKDGDDEAVQKLWHAYFHRLVALARTKLRGVQRRAEDEEDAAPSAFDSFCRGAEHGRFPQLNNREDLWRLLVMITARKACDLAEMALAGQAAGSSGGARRLSHLLEAWRPLGNERDRRGWEWYCLRPLVDESSLVIFNRAGPVRAVCWKADGRCLASADASSMVQIWDTGTGRQLASLSTAMRNIQALGWSPDGRYLAVAGPGQPTIGIWDTRTFKQSASLESHTQGVVSLTWAPDSQRLASGSKDRTVRVWDIPAFQQVRELPIGGNVNSVRWSPDPEGKRQTVSKARQMLLFDTVTWKQVHHDIKCQPMDWSPNGKWLATADFNMVELWDVTLDRPRSMTRPRQGMFAHSVSWGRHHRLAIARSNSSVEVHDLTFRSRNLSSTLLRGHEGGVNCVFWSPDGRLASGSSDRTIRVWNLNTLEGAKILPSNNTPQAVSWSPDGEYLMLCEHDGSARLWKRSTGKFLPDPAVNQGPHLNYRPLFCWSPDGRRLASSTNGTGLIEFREPTTAKVISVLGKHGARLRTIAWSADGRRLASGGTNGVLKVSDVEAKKEITSSLRCSARFAHGGVAWSPNGAWLAAANSGSGVQLWDAVTLQQRGALLGHREAVLALTWSPEGKRLATGGYDHVIKIWDVEDARELISLDGHLDTVTDLSWSPDGKCLASSSWDRSVKLWDMEKGKEITSLYGHGDANVDCVRWNPDGTCLASGGNDGYVRLWDTIPGYLAERSSLLLPLLERKRRAHPDNTGDLRLRAEVHARRGAWKDAAADWTKSAKRDKPAGAAWFDAGWWLRGPLGCEEVADEDSADIDPTHSLSAGTARVLSWRPVTPSANGCIDLERLFPGRRTGCVQVLARVYSPQEQRITGRLGCGGPLRAWLNGRSIYAHKEVRPVEAEDEKVTVELAAGWNTLLLRVELGERNWIAFVLR
jgi:WD40 repeat protein